MLHGGEKFSSKMVSRVACALEKDMAVVGLAKIEHDAWLVLLSG